MPIESFSSEEAAKNLRSDRACRWPDGRASGTRLEGLATVTVKPSFTFSKNDKIFTIGSCFAREIEKYMHGLGFEIPALSINIPESERVTGTANDILSKFSVHSMESELRWAFSTPGFAPEDFYLKAEEGKWHDAQMVPNLRSATLERVIERRAMVTDLMRKVPECRIIIITLGLAEAWFDLKTGLYLNGKPTQEAIGLEPNRFRIDVLAYEDIVASLERIHDILAQHGHPDFKMLITVSPVPFKATFSGKDALIANTYSKSVQRAAAAAFASAHANVDYFPSYEIATLSDRKVAYELDNIHVTPQTVAKIMAMVVAAYVPGAEANTAPAPETAIAASRVAASTKKVLRTRAISAMGEKDFDTAVNAFSSMLFRFGDTMTTDEEFDARFRLAKAMLGARLTKEGIVQLERARTLSPEHAGAAYTLAIAYGRLKMSDNALAMFREACRLDPSDRNHHWRLGAELVRIGRVEEGLQHVQGALKIDPAHAESLAIVEQYATAAAS